jgi:hypothetical protein
MVTPVGSAIVDSTNLSVSSGTWTPASNPGLHRTNGSVQFQTLQKTQLADYCRAKHRLVPVNLQDLPGEG